MCCCLQATCTYICMYVIMVACVLLSNYIQYKCLLALLNCNLTIYYYFSYRDCLLLLLQLCFIIVKLLFVVKFVCMYACKMAIVATLLISPCLVCFFVVKLIYCALFFLFAQLCGIQMHTTSCICMFVCVYCIGLIFLFKVLVEHIFIW